LVAAAACYAKTPNGLALSNTNRAVVYFLAGKYDLGVAELPVGQFVDFKSLSPTKSVIVTTANATATLKIADTNNYSLEGFTIANTSTGKSIGHNSSATDNGNWDNLYFAQGNNTENTIFAGNYIDCDFSSIQALNGSIIGLVDNCKFSNTSCGYSATSSVEIYGTIKNSTAAGNSFGCSENGGVIISGLIENCHSPYNSFGYTSGVGFDIIISGKIKNCTAPTNFSFGSTIDNTGNIYISGEINNCVGEAFSFGYSSVFARVEISGIVKNCTATSANCFGSTTSAGIIENCKGLNSFGEHSGELISCKFVFPESGTKDVVILKDGAKVIKCVIIQNEPSLDSIKIESGAEVKITHCETNQDFNLISGDPYTNLIAIPYNVIDSNL
jgi:hypothetical protein